VLPYTLVVRYGALTCTGVACSWKMVGLTILSVSLWGVSIQSRSHTLLKRPQESQTARRAPSGLAVSAASSTGRPRMPPRQKAQLSTVSITITLNGTHTAYKIAILILLLRKI
jgi:hypothetical protein